MTKKTPNKKTTAKKTDNEARFRVPFLPEHLDEPHEIKNKLQEELDEFQKTFINELSTLITSAFGLLAALAWRGVIQELVDVYIKRFLGEMSGILSELIFALIITVLAVVLTWRITKLKKRLFGKN
ncbi:MAG: DUF5654 family protein [Candidatus Shapirobacteria bacterium]|nr:DUF5654 family protein [Candidatus Shapirobacteria bacterium]MDD5073858.1 DUF5654 family protein [Candidatus Shapirobacteria bacterium]MDD5481735.1 DUF5654 family protein [Candidatus Shapirobacteria bacterium]